jgi:hypothetical protein
MVEALSAYSSQQRARIASNPFYGIRFDTQSKKFRVQANGSLHSTLLEAMLSRDRHMSARVEAYQERRRERRERTQLERILGEQNIRYTINPK